MVGAKENGMTFLNFFMKPINRWRFSVKQSRAQPRTIRQFCETAFRRGGGGGGFVVSTLVTEMTMVRFLPAMIFIAKVSVKICLLDINWQNSLKTSS